MGEASTPRDPVGRDLEPVINGVSHPKGFIAIQLKMTLDNIITNHQ